ncbi:MAG: carbohydrate porin [Polyangia bacterium]
MSGASSRASSRASTRAGLSRRLRLPLVAVLLAGSGLAWGQAQPDAAAPPPSAVQAAPSAARQADPVPDPVTSPAKDPVPDPVPSPPPSQASTDAGGAQRASSHTAFGSSGSPPPASLTGSGFDFGSYGRVGIGSDLRGHSGYGVNVVSFGSRLEKPAYLELNFYYGGTLGDDGDKRWRVIFVPAFAGDLFHYTGSFSQNFAIRNAYAEVENLGVRGLSLWAGSRMYRGDDVYLFDFWPLDNLNTVGGGANYAIKKRTNLAVHIGMNRLDDLYQVQVVKVPSRRLPSDGVILGPQPATANVTVLDRQRLVASFKLTHFLRDLALLPNGKLVLYGEFHYLPRGERQPEITGLMPQPLPEDYGYVVGAQLGGWLRSFVFANLFFRHAGGLGAFGDLGKPYGFGSDQRTWGTREYTVAASANYESRHVGVMVGGYFRAWSDANASRGGDDTGYKEGAAAVRPTVYFGKYFHTAVELSYQVRRPNTVDQDVARYLTPMVARASVMPIVAPLGRGTYSRPFLYGIYTLSYLTGDAQYYLFEPMDVRAGKALVHYLGLGVEWWFNSSYR